MDFTLPCSWSIRACMRSWFLRSSSAAKVSSLMDLSDLRRFFVTSAWRLFSASSSDSSSRMRVSILIMAFLPPFRAETSASSARVAASLHWASSSFLSFSRFMASSCSQRSSSARRAASTMEKDKKLLENRVYSSSNEFATDMRLMFTNCYKYNPPDHEVVVMARKLQDVFEMRFAKIPDEPRMIGSAADCKGEFKVVESDIDSEDERERKLMHLQDQLKQMQDQIKQQIDETLRAKGSKNKQKYGGGGKGKQRTTGGGGTSGSKKGSKHFTTVAVGSA